MENKNNPLSPHLQVYRWHISSLLSITHRIVGIMNFFCIIFLLSLLIFIQDNNQILQLFSDSFFGEFFVISLCWSFSFQILNEIRHLAWDIGYGFDLKVSQITGIATILGSFILAILFYFVGRGLI
ncbi:MAG: succinate dehydrogenase, cytochrome b556 subunit [Candidatus Marinimicrobia bacterium]|mgnify:CR=1 FL=1|nr:succinate dehydrogenase, cytochrome b556 subunit [Candidatus Neomarinimicrobiota bacterium]RPG04868.1 MAG: succinate dehydrogenase, cytochrome b556 subunit [Pelagibacteraceae bacterium TMED247]|tara:strand:- start:843 stop:1220 length:378 start_codon:yes stop_codon:yes gene_type:complete